MAELILRIGTVGPNPKSQDGDILIAYNNRRIWQVNASVICHVRKEGFQLSGLRKNTGLAKAFRDRCMQYKFERVSINELKRIDQFTQEEQIFTYPTGQLDKKVQRMMNINNPLIWGSVAHEIWYGGKIHQEIDVVNSIWQMIEEKTPMRKVNYGLAPRGFEDLKQRLTLPVDDFDDGTALDYETPDQISKNILNLEKKMVEKKFTLRKRCFMLNYETLDLPVSIDDIRDKTKSVDIRKQIQPINRAASVLQKPELTEEEKTEILDKYDIPKVK